MFPVLSCTTASTVVEKPRNGSIKFCKMVRCLGRVDRETSVPYSAWAPLAPLHTVYWHSNNFHCEMLKCYCPKLHSSRKCQVGASARGPLLLQLLLLQLLPMTSSAWAVSSVPANSCWGGLWGFLCVWRPFLLLGKWGVAVCLRRVHPCTRGVLFSFPQRKVHCCLMAPPS